MTAYASSPLNSPEETVLFVSEIEPVASTITLTLDRKQHSKAHAYLGVEFFSDALGATPVTASAGTVTATVSTAVNPQGSEALTGGGVIDATALSTLDWSGNTREVVCTPAALATAVYWRVNLILNRS
jgi:hypothetical protein